VSGAKLVFAPFSLYAEPLQALEHLFAPEFGLFATVCGARVRQVVKADPAGAEADQASPEANRVGPGHNPAVP
jgi:hypothetical protein